MRPQVLKRTIGRNTLLLMASFLLVAGGNATFFSNVLQAFPLSGNNIPALASLAFTFFALNVILIGGVALGRLTKPVLTLVLLVSSLTAYFTDSFGVVISEEMLTNVVQTTAGEAADLITLKLLAYFVLLGVLPSALVWHTPLHWQGWRHELIARAKLLGLCLLGIMVMVMAFGSFYASFVRAHKSLRNYANPTYFLVSSIKFIGGKNQPDRNLQMAVVAPDAHISKSDKDRELVILVIGETARADRLSINGYDRDTSPRLKESKAISLANFWACGTSTAVSVPCMFSPGGMDRFSLKKAGSEENLLDIVQRAGVERPVAGR